MIEYPAAEDALPSETYWERAAVVAEVAAKFHRRFRTPDRRDNNTFSQESIPDITWAQLTRQIRNLGAGAEEQTLLSGLRRLRRLAAHLMPAEAVFREIILLSHQHLATAAICRPDPRSVWSRHPELSRALYVQEVSMT